MSTGLFSDEEDGYNLDEIDTIEETKFKLKVPNSEPSVDNSLDGLEDFSDDSGVEDLDGMEDLGGETSNQDKPFNDEPFEAGVEADEESDPKTYIQQLAGKLGQSLRTYSGEQGQADFDLEKFVINSVISATHTGQMENEDQSDIIKKVKSSGNDGGGDIDVNVDVDTDSDNVDNVDVNTNDSSDTEFNDDEVTEEGIDLGLTPHNPNNFDTNDTKHYYDADVTRVKDGLKGKVIRFGQGKLKIKITDGENIGKIFYASPSEVEIDSPIGKGLSEGKKKKIDCKNCGWSWDESSSTASDLYNCHKCGNDNTPNVSENESPCWSGYKQIGTKIKSGKTVPNCVPVNENKKINLVNDKKSRNFVYKDKIMNKLIEATEVEPSVKPKTKPKTNPDVKPTRRQRPFRPIIQPKVEPKADDTALTEGEGTHGKIIDTKFLDEKLAIIKVSLDDNEIDIKFENTGEYVDKPLAYDEPWIYTYESVNSPDEKTYVIGVEFLGHPETNLELVGISDTYIENK